MKQKVHDAVCQSSSAAHRLAVVSGLAVAVCVLGYLFNVILPSVDLVGEEWRFPKILPVIRPVGTDFSNGIYLPGQLLLSGKNPYSIANWYPPLVAVLGVPLSLLSPHKAYVLQLAGLIAANLATIVLALRIAGRAIESSEVLSAGASRHLGQGGSVLLGFMALTSYGFLFSLERGNYDIYAQLLSVFVLWMLIEHPRRMWLQIGVLSIAAHLKIYPAILFLLVFWRHRWKSALPLVVFNACLLLVQGWERMLDFLSQLRGGVNYLWIGNHSALSFVATVLEPMKATFPHAKEFFMLLPIVLWGVSAVLLWTRGFTAPNAIKMFAVSVPVMCLLPGTSHDYKLVILTAPLLMVSFILAARFVARGRLYDLAAVVALFALAVFISRSYAVTSTVWLQNKYPFVLGVQFVTFFCWVLPREWLHPKRDGTALEVETLRVSVAAF